MGSERVELKTLVRIKGGKRLPKGKLLQSTENAHPYIRVRDMGERYLPRNGLEFVPDEVFPKIKNYIVHKNDVLISIVGTVGLISVIDEHFDRASQTENCAKLSGLDTSDALYLYYFLTSAEGQSEIKTQTVGAVQPKLPLYGIENISITWPTRSRRAGIAEILSRLDDKIQLNRQMNSTLEAMAQALFKSWFVDFDPVIDNALAAGNEIPAELAARAERRAQALHPTASEQPQTLPAAIRQQFPDRFVFTDTMGWVPEGWDVGKLGNYVTVKRGGSPRPIHDFLVAEGLPWVKISDATASSSRFLMETKQFIKPEGLKKTVMLKKGELILSNSATPGLPKFLNLDACIHDGWLYFPSKKKFQDHYLYQLFLVVRQQLLMQGNGSVFTNLKTDILKEHLVILPRDSLLNEANNRFRELHQKSLALQEEIDTLINVRDALLPKLLSGQLRIPDVVVN